MKLKSKLKGSSDQRTGVRAVALWENKVLMVHAANSGEYMFPGGGVNSGESHEAGLHRELAEECGMRVKKLLGRIGTAVEYRQPKFGGVDYFCMESHYFLCSVHEDLIFDQKLEDYERELGLTPIWMPISEAIRENEKFMNTHSKLPFWVSRETKVMNLLRNSLTDLNIN